MPITMWPLTTRRMPDPDAAMQVCACGAMGERLMSERRDLARILALAYRVRVSRPDRGRQTPQARVLRTARLWARSLVCLVAWVLPGVSPAQEASRPRVMPGDQWQHVVYYGQRSTTPNRFWRIERVTEEALEGTENGGPLRLSPELNLIESPMRRDTDVRALRFPLRVGDAWTYESDMLFKDNGSTARSFLSVNVVAYERISVVAGEFEAFKLHAVGRFRGRSRGGPGVLEGEFTSTYWYAPAARAIVKSTTTNPYRGTTHVELVSAQLQP